MTTEKSVFWPYIQYIDQVISRHDWSPDARKQLADGLALVKQRMMDKCVNISMLGETSAGKSSVINALLGVDLVKMDQLPDTTLVASVIYYAPNPAFEIEYRDGSKYTLEHPTFSEIREKLAQYSLRELPQSSCQVDSILKEREKVAAKAEKVKCFKIGIPSGFLQKGFRIIDTPGLNTDNADCINVTKRVLAFADSSIIVNRAIDGCIRENFRDNLEEFLGKRISQCVFVLTYFDQISRKDAFVNMSKNRMAAEFGIDVKDIVIAPMVPPTVLAHMRGEKFGADHDELLELTSQSIAKIEAFSISNKNKTIINSLYELTLKVIESLRNNIPALRATYGQKLLVLENSRTPQLQPFIREFTRKTSLQIAQEIAIKKGRMQADFRKITDNTIDSIDKKILSADDLEGVKKIFDNNIPYILEVATKEMNSVAQKAASELQVMIETIMETFERNVQQEFKRMSMIPITVKIQPSEIGMKHLQLNESMIVASQFAAAEADREGNAAGLAVLGGIIGMFFGGVGAPIGVAIGALIGSQGRSLTVKSTYKKLKPKYDEELRKSFSKQGTQLIDAIDSHSEHLKACLDKKIKLFLERYEMSINEMIAEHKRNEVNIQYRITSLEQDVKGIKNIQKELSEKWN